MLGGEGVGNILCRDLNIAAVGGGRRLTLMAAKAGLPG